MGVKVSVPVGVRDGEGVAVGELLLVAVGEAVRELVPLCEAVTELLCEVLPVIDGEAPAVSEAVGE